MATIKVMGGSVDKKWNWVYSNGQIRGSKGFSDGKTYGVKAMQELAIADEKTGVKVMGAVGWGTVGALVAGPVGVIVGGLLGGRGETITFIGKFNDDKTIMGQVPKKVWLKMLADRM